MGAIPGGGQDYPYQPIQPSIPGGGQDYPYQPIQPSNQQGMTTLSPAALKESMVNVAQTIIAAGGGTPSPSGLYANLSVLESGLGNPEPSSIAGQAMTILQEPFFPNNMSLQDALKDQGDFEGLVKASPPETWTPLAEQLQNLSDRL